MSPFRPTTVIELSEDDFERRVQFCNDILVRFDAQPDLIGKVIWSDESEFKLNGTINRHNSCYWSHRNPQVQFPVQHTSNGVMVWAGITSKRVIGPYFVNGLVNAESYLELLDHYLWPKIQHRGLFFQKDGAPAHYADVVREWLNTKLPNRWIGRRGPIEWPARSPDLSPCDFYLWGRLKDIVYRERVHTLDELRDRIRIAFDTLFTYEIEAACNCVQERLRQCVALSGAQLTD